MRTSSAWIVLVLGTLALCLGPAAVAGAQFADRETAAAAYRQILADQQVPADWSGNVGTCTRGTESEASIAATLETLNILRYFAGLGTVRTDPVYNRRALAAALLMHANHALDHTPPKTWKCWTQEGADAANRSSLSGFSPGATSIAEFVDDDGDLGHRRSLLDPALAVVGTGSTHVRNTTEAYHALYTGEELATTPVPEVVAWPPPGHVPWPLIDEGDDTDDDRWSASLSVPGLDLSDPDVAVTFDGKPRVVTDVEHLATGYGQGEAVGWRVPLTAGDRAEARFIGVSITVPVNGQPRTFTYAIDAFPVDAPPAQPEPQARVPAELALKALKVRKGRLIGRLGITSLADGDRLTLKLRAKGRTATFRVPIASGRAVFRIRLTRAQRRAKIKAIFSYAGSDTVEPATLRRKLTR